MFLQCLSDTQFHQVLVLITSLTHQGGISALVFVFVWEWCKRQGKRQREREKGVEEGGGEALLVLHLCWIVTMGDCLGTTSQAETGLPPFVHRGSLQREEKGKMEPQQSALWERKYEGGRGHVCVLYDVWLCALVWAGKTGTDMAGWATVCPTTSFVFRKKPP